MSDEAITTQIPTEDTEFVQNEEGKNATKIEFDMEHNAAFLQELQDKLAACGSETDAEKIKADFKSMTGLDIDELMPALPALDAPKPEVIVPVGEESVPATVVEIEEDPSAISEEILNQVDQYMEDPSVLKFTQEEIEGIVKIGVFDRDTIELLTVQMNRQIDEIVAGRKDPESPYYVESVCREAIANTLNIRVSTLQAVEKSKELISDKFIDELFQAKYPEYCAIGPAHLLNDFATYLKRRVETREAVEHVVLELNSYQKITEILNRAKTDIFDTMYLTDGRKFSLGMFMSAVFEWVKPIAAKEIGIPETELSLKKCESLLIVFTTLFTRWMYKHIIPDMKTRAIQRKYFYRFIYDNSNAMSLSGDKFEALNESWATVLNLCGEIATECNKRAK